MTSDALTQLLKENESQLLVDRRSSNRRTFVRPVQISHPRHGPIECSAFSRDISLEGIGIISSIPWQPFQRAKLSVHSVRGKILEFQAEVRWCEPFGKDWYLVGWSFL